MDFGKESTKDLPNHGFDKTVVTGWLLEGLIMYLDEASVESIYTEVSELAAPGSYMILNFINS